MVVFTLALHMHISQSLGFPALVSHTVDSGSCRLLGIISLSLSIEPYRYVRTPALGIFFKSLLKGVRPPEYL